MVKSGQERFKIYKNVLLFKNWTKHTTTQKAVWVLLYPIIGVLVFLIESDSLLRYLLIKVDGLKNKLLSKIL